MAEYRQTDLFGGAITASLPSTFGDVSEIRQVPDNQEVYLDQNGFTSIVFDILERVDKPADAEALEFHLLDVVGEEDAPRVKVLHTEEEVKFEKLPAETKSLSILATSPPGPKQRGRAHEPDVVAILLTLVRLEAQKTDLVISINVPHIPGTDGTYTAGDVDLAGCKYGPLIERAVEYRSRIAETFEIKDWGLFVQE